MCGPASPGPTLRDGQAIVFAKDQDGDEHNNIRFYLLAIPSGKVIQLNSDPDTQEYVGEVHPDNRTLAELRLYELDGDRYQMLLADFLERRL